MKKPELSEDGVPLDGGIAYNRGYLKTASPFRGARRETWLTAWQKAADRAAKARDDELLDLTRKP